MKRETKLLISKQCNKSNFRETRGAPYYPDMWWYDKAIHAKFIIKLKNVHYENPSTNS